MRWLRAVLIPVAMLLLVSCGGDDDEGGDGNGDATTVATAEATSQGGGGDGGSSGGGSSISSDDIDQLIEDLTPPNSTEVARFSAPDGTNVSFQSTDSLEDLADFYDDKLGDLGITVTGTMTVEGTQTWVFGEGDDIAGGVTISSDGENSLVTIIAGQ